jgi:trk system potassium uptake protein TrkH
LLYGEGIWQAYLLSAGITAGVAGVVWFFTNPDRQDRLGKRVHDRQQKDYENQEDFEPISRELNLREGLMVVGFIYVLLSLFGALPFTLSGTLHSYTDATFEAASGFTTTGATILGGETASGIQNPAIEDVPKSLLFWRSLSHWLGGMGIIVLSIAILPLLNLGGMKLFSAESSMMMSDRRFMLR